jgi:hypothetical protein
MPDKRGVLSSILSMSGAKPTSIFQKTYNLNTAVLLYDTVTINSYCTAL